MYFCEIWDGEGLPWVVEVSEYILFLSTFLAAPWVMHKEGHTRMDALIKLFPKKIGEIFRDVGNLFVMLVCLFMLVYGAQAAWEAFSLNAIIYKQLEIPEWWLLSIVPFCGFLLVSEFIFRVMHKLGWGDAATKQRRE